MSDAVVFVLASLCAFRLWRLWAVDKLPPVVWARERVEAFVDRRYGYMWADGVTCPACAGFWVSVVVFACVWIAKPLPLPALWPFAVSAVVIWLAQVDEG